ncbi:MAG: hypothetical protein QOE72_1249 [Chloroflexota bacterium]|jgi:hypothetical protein|nr:hypothetical protein [Chloroflexota bacterium]
MSNRVMTGAVAVAAASLLLGGVIARAADLGPAPAPVADTLAAPQAPAPDPWAALPVTPLAPVTTLPVPVGPAAPNSRPQDTATTAAPPGGATASVIQVNPIDTCISCTSASAGSDSGSAKATAVRLLGNDVSGGRSEGGPTSGALLAVPASPLLTLAIADWATSASSGTSHSRAALADLVVGPSGHQSGGVLSVAVLEATSEAGYKGLSSEGSGENNGVDLNVGDGALVVLLLHSDASSRNSGSAYVAGINGTRVLGSEQTGAAGIPIAVPGVVGLILLQVNANGGAGSAAVGNVSDLLGQSGQAAGVLTASAVGVPSTGAPDGGIATGVATTPSTGSGLTAPNTGMALGLSGLLILPAGLALLFLTLRRRRDSAG